MTILPALREDIPEILALQKLAFYAQACIYSNFRIRPLRATIEDLESDWEVWTYIKGLQDGRIIASARGRMEGDTCHVGNVIVRPDMQGRGLGKAILAAIEAAFPEARRYELFTGALSTSNLAFYSKAGYRAFRRQAPAVGEPELVFMEKTP
jgi:GNAT superfamily N-acetyltransferase